MRKRFGEVTRHAFHDHADVRLSMIKSALAQEQRPIVILGDSVAEMARFPSEVCGHPVINAGIGGARLEELTRITDMFADASVVIVVAGTNDAQSPTFSRDYANLLRRLRPKPFAIPATAFPEINDKIVKSAKEAGIAVLDIRFGSFTDVHPTPTAYREWTTKVVSALSSECSK